jgi:DICT domain-containing protein
MKSKKEWAPEIVAALTANHGYPGYWDVDREIVDSVADALENVIAAVQSDAIRSIQRAQLEALATVAERHWVKCDDAPMPDIPAIIHRIKESL